MSNNDSMRPFSELDFDSIDLSDSSERDKNGLQWMFSMSDHGLPNGTYFIKSVDNDFNITTYPLPECINQMIRIMNEWAKDEVRGAIRQALGI